MIWGQDDTSDLVWKQASKFLDVGEAATAVDVLPYNLHDSKLVILFNLLIFFVLSFVAIGHCYM